jgi:hypothetical protein
MTGLTDTTFPEDDTDILPPLADIIDYLAATDPDTWWEGPTFRSPCGTRHCVLSHVAEKWGPSAWSEFEALYSTSYAIGATVNDRPTEAYPQPHPRERVVAYLQAMLAGHEQTTSESMEADYQYWLAHEQAAVTSPDPTMTTAGVRQ